MAHTVVVGGGVIGLLAACELSRRGERVTLLDRGAPGAGCSSGNLGWICPVHSDPLPAPGLAARSIRWMLRRENPLYIHPPALPWLGQWLWQFWRHCNRRDYEAGLEALAHLNRDTLARYDALAADGVRFEIHRSRLMLVALSGTKVEEAIAGSRIMSRWGHPPPDRLSAAQARELEPGLSSAVAGALLYGEERHVRPDTLCAGLSAELQRRGVAIRNGIEVSGIDQRYGVARAVLAQADRIHAQADRFLIAAGARSGGIARRFGFRLPLQAGKGYSITVRRPGCRVGRPLYFADHHAGGTPFDGALRLGGTMELSGVNERLDRRRIAAIRQVAERYLPGVFAGDPGEEWVGMRPMTPDGLPVIGRVPGLDNVFIATGHGMLGMTLAPATAAAVTDLMITGKETEVLRPFDPTRFR